MADQPKRVHCMRCGKLGTRTESNGREVYSCTAMGHGMIASYDLPATEPGKAAQPEAVAEPEKGPETTVEDANASGKK